jgi:hypothetical protein
MEPVYKPLPPPPIKEPEPYLNATEGLSGIGRAMRDKYMDQQEAGTMKYPRPIPPIRVESEGMERMPRPVDEAYKKGGRVKRKSDMSHMSHADHVKKHYAVGGFMHHSDHAKKLCGGGYMKGNK